MQPAGISPPSLQSPRGPRARERTRPDSTLEPIPERTASRRADREQGAEGPESPTKWSEDVPFRMDMDLATPTQEQPPHLHPQFRPHQPAHPLPEPYWLNPGPRPRARTEPAQPTPAPATIILPQPTPIARPTQSRTDPRLWFFPPNPTPRPPISAPVQPRVGEIRISVERDPQQQTPTFEVHVRFNFTMRPGDLR